MVRKLSVLVCLVLIPAFCTVVIGAQEPPPGQAKGKPAEQPAAAKAKTAEPAKEKKEASKTSTDEEPVVTHHSVRVDGQNLNYTSTAGLMPIRNERARSRHGSSSSPTRWLM